MFKKSVFAILLLMCALTFLFIWLIKDQGMAKEDWQDFTGAKVVFDKYGIPTIEADSWEKLVFAQGFVTASQRLWQMDVLRRYASGRLSEWFGEATVAFDRRKHAEDWTSIARRNVALLPPDEKKFCDLYADGVNQFIDAKRRSWGLEYTLMMTEPEKWTCMDTVLVGMYMGEVLTSDIRRKSVRYAWQKHLPDPWKEFLFPRYHPWAKPIFGSNPINNLEIPEEEFWLKRPKTLEIDKISSNSEFGSNAWVWREGENVYLASDPHLRNSVPMVWYANRLRISERQWVVGGSIPGIPGVLIGMNQSFANAFTNLYDDVDDIYLEKIDRDQKEYLAYKKNGQEFWRRIIKKKYKFKVKGEEDYRGEVWLTHRGPVEKRENLKGYYSRQWTLFWPGAVGLSPIRMNQARTWGDFNGSLDRMQAPSQAALYASASGELGFRASGIGVIRRNDSRFLKQGTEGEWLRLAGISERKRKLIPRGFSKKYIVNANGQIWFDEHGQRWASEDRRKRIEDILKKSSRLKLSDMLSIQRDTVSDYHRLLLGWLYKNLKGAPKEWQRWDGDASKNKKIFTQAVLADEILRGMLLGIVRKNFFPKDFKVPYKYQKDRSWTIVLLEKPGSFKAFGMTDRELASEVYNRVKKRYKEVFKYGARSYQDENRWNAQHPFVAKVPLVGRLFRVKEYPQPGFTRLVRMESPKSGASMRVVFDLQNPENSRWIFPIGQSGHIRSVHYRDMQSLWREGKTIPVFDSSFKWVAAAP